PVSSYHEKEEKFNLEELEKKTIQEALHHCSGNLTQAADLLGITRTSLYRRLEKYGL
ncbi:helix-turn-helix domain-containing protein, partial [Parabacteroides goldsteinii]